MRDLQGGDTHALLALFSGLSATQRQKSLRPVETHNQSVITGFLGMHVAQRSRCVTGVQRSWAPAKPWSAWKEGTTGQPIREKSVGNWPQACLRNGGRNGDLSPFMRNETEAKRQ